jgi:hypothetical protein
MDSFERVPALRAFWGGLTGPGLSSVLGAMVFALIELALAVAWITPRNLARTDPAYLKENRTDDRAVTTIGALRLRFSRSPNRAVVMLGASNARKGLVDGGENVERELRRASGEHVDVHRLFADRQMINEWVAILDQLPPDFEGIVVFTIFDVLSRAENKMPDRLALTSPSLQRPSDAIRLVLDAPPEEPPVFGAYFLDHLSFFAARRSVLVRLGTAPPRHRRRTPRHHRAANARVRAVWANAKKRLTWRDEPLLFEYLPALEDVVRSVKRPGVEVVFVEAPVNPRFDAMKPEHQARRIYEPEMFQFAKKTGAHYWNPSVPARLHASEFKDYVHLVDRAAEARYEAALVDRLAALLRGEEVADGPSTPELDPSTLDDDPVLAEADPDQDDEDFDEDL